MFKNLLDNAPVAVLVSRTSDGEVLYANNKLADMVGLPLEQLVGRKTPDFYYDPADRARVLDVLRTQGKVENFELHVKRADGTPFWVETSFETITFAGEPAIFAGYTDITRRKEAEGSIQSSETRFGNFAKAASDYFWEMDENLRFVYFSDRFEEVTGVAPEQLLGKTRQETGIPDIEQEIWQNHLADLAAHRPFRNFTHPRKRPDGKAVVLSISGVPVFDDNDKFKGYRGSGSDITERIRAEEQMRMRPSRSKPKLPIACGRRLPTRPK